MTATNTIKPLIKWTGGKYDEFDMFANHIPSFEKYYEPFFGGGGVFFAVQPKCPCYLNDISTDLIQFYTSVHNHHFQKELWKYVQAWKQVGALAYIISVRLTTIISEYLAGKVAIQILQEEVHSKLAAINTTSYKPLFNASFIISKKQFIQQLQSSIVDKCKRLRVIGIKEHCVFTTQKVCTPIETAVRSGLYLHIRAIMNGEIQGTHTISAEKKLATWYFVRELCYGSMFRYNRRGLFNIPYGGTSYNKKNLHVKVQHVCSVIVQQLLSKAHFSNLDFEDFLNAAKPSEDDFVFVDPPYDTAFSAYDTHPFTKADHLRLRNVLVTLKAKWLLVIKETPYIRKLYSHSCFHVSHYDKSYTHNIKGRTNRRAKHLVITNYPL